MRGRAIAQREIQISLPRNQGEGGARGVSGSCRIPGTPYLDCCLPSTRRGRERWCPSHANCTISISFFFSSPFLRLLEQPSSPFARSGHFPSFYFSLGHDRESTKTNEKADNLRGRWAFNFHLDLGMQGEKLKFQRFLEQSTPLL